MNLLNTTPVVPMVPGGSSTTVAHHQEELLGFNEPTSAVFYLVGGTSTR